MQTLAIRILYALAAAIGKVNYCALRILLPVFSYLHIPTLFSYLGTYSTYLAT